MLKWIFALVVLVNIVFFSVMHWGRALTVEANNPSQQAAFNADKLRIVAENAHSATEVTSLTLASTVSTPISAVAVTSMVAPTMVKLSCMEWGEFSGTDLLRAEKVLAGLKLGERIKQRMVEYPSGYWVYIAPLKTHLEIEQKIAQLKGRGIADYFVVQEAGPWQNAISLGVFKTEDAAKKYLSRLQEQGVKTALIGERASKLKFTIFVLDHLDSAMLAQVAALHRDFPDSEAKPVSCN